MTGEAAAFWDRAKRAVATARGLVRADPDAAASRAYYAAFYAVSAWFALAGRTFTRHSAVEAAVHRDLVKAGIWDRRLGKGYSRLVDLRDTGDYGVAQRISAEEADVAVDLAERILRAVAAGRSNELGDLDIGE